MTITQFLAVFNDNFYKQIVVLVCVDIAEAGGKQGLGGIATALFTIPFILLSGYCGFLSDRFSKRTIVVVSKIAEIAIMGLAMIAFMPVNISLIFVVLFLIGIHSTLYAPAKYGLLPELFSKRDLPKVNGLFQMSLFVAIILGLAAAGIAKEMAAGRLWVTSLISMGIACLGFCSSLLIRPVPAARPGMKFDKSDLIVNKETRKMLWATPTLLAALFATSAFWATGGLVYPLAITDLGRKQFGLSESFTSYMAAGTGLGIAVGCVLGMLWSHQKFNARLVRVGGWGMLAGLLLISLPGNSPQTNFLGLGATTIVLVVLGICAGLYSVPLQVLIQAKAPAEHKGRVIGAMSLANWIGIYLAAMIYSGVSPLTASWNLPPATMFAVGAIFLTPVLLFYWPRSEDFSDAPDVDAPADPERSLQIDAAK